MQASQPRKRSDLAHYVLLSSQLSPLWGCIMRATTKNQTIIAVTQRKNIKLQRIPISTRDPYLDDSPVHNKEHSLRLLNVNESVTLYN